jgi:hypothetical protein
VSDRERRVVIVTQWVDESVIEDKPLSARSYSVHRRRAACPADARSVSNLFRAAALV